MFNDGQQIASVAVPRLVELARSSELMLPPLQRNAVWEPWQIAALWDSVLRGMPIGTFLVYWMRNGDLARSITERDEGQLQEMPEGRLALFDGQQRVKALMHGYPASRSAEADGVREGRMCVWIDLGAKPGKGGRDGQDVPAFQFRITTFGRPFGYDTNNKGKLADRQIRAARESYSAWRSSRAGQPVLEDITDLDLFDIHRSPERTGCVRLPRPTPWDATRYTAALPDLIDAYLADGPHPSLDHLLEGRDGREPTLGRRYGGERAGDAEERQRAEDALARFVEGLSWARDLQVGLQLVRAHVVEGEAAGAGAPPSLVTLFDRVGRNGAQLSPDDLTFTKIKARYRAAHDTVHAIHHGWKEANKKDPIGAILSQTEIVLLALRVARLLAHKPGAKELPPVVKPSATDVPALGGAAANDCPVAKRFIHLVPGRERINGEGSIATLLWALVKTLRFRPAQDAQGKTLDPGLPRPCFPSLDFDLMSVLASWLALASPGACEPLGERTRALTSEQMAEASRSELLRFVMWWRLCVRKRPEVAGDALAWLFKERQNIACFPGKELYDIIRKKGSPNDPGAWCLPHPERLPFHPAELDRRRSELEPRRSERGAPQEPVPVADPLACRTPVLRGDSERFGNWEDLVSRATSPDANTQDRMRLHDRETATAFWNAMDGKRDRADLLIWLQRAYVAREFPDYDPLALRENDKPYDLDHISPQRRTATGGEGNFTERKFQGLGVRGDPVFDQFGMNRTRITNSIGNYRAILLGKNRSDGDASIETKLFIGGDPDGHWDDWAMAEGRAADWLSASGEGTVWSDDQVEALQAAVEGRAIDLYTRFYDELGFRGWDTENDC